MVSLTLQENFRAVFYAPFYAAFSLGAFEAEGLDVKLARTPVPSDAALDLFSGEVEVAWGGPMRALVVGDSKPESDLAVFCEVGGYDPFFLVGRDPAPQFRLVDLLKKKVATVNEVATPWMCLQHDLRLAGIDPAQIGRLAEGSMPENVSALRTGKVDIVQVFKPFAEELVRRGEGHIWYTAASRGRTSYTAFFATKAFLEREPEAPLRLTRAIYRVQKRLLECSGEEIAGCVASFFPDLPREILGAAFTRYKEVSLWSYDPILPREGFERLRASYISGGFIQRGVSFEACAENRFAEQAMKEDPPSM